ncbi:rRNA maturation RNase YbeY [Calditrichota bacterium]
MNDENTVLENIATFDQTESIADEILARVKLLAATILAAESDQSGEVNIVFTDNEILRSLNNTWRGKDEPTDVLSFSLREQDDHPVEGDVYISVPIAEVQGQEAGHGLEFEIYHLVAHGILHLCGWQHESESALKTMIAEGASFIELVLQDVSIGS